MQIIEVSKAEDFSGYDYDVASGSWMICLISCLTGCDSLGHHALCMRSSVCLPHESSSAMTSSLEEDLSRQHTICRGCCVHKAILFDGWLRFEVKVT